MRTAAKRDIAEVSIVTGLRICGVVVFFLDEPCDLLTYYRGRWQPLEVKTGKKRRTHNQEAANVLAPIPIVRTLDEAYQAVGISFGHDRGEAWRYVKAKQAREGDWSLLNTKIGGRPRGGGQGGVILPGPILALLLGLALILGSALFVY